MPIAYLSSFDSKIEIKVVVRVNRLNSSFIQVALVVFSLSLALDYRISYPSSFGRIGRSLILLY